MKSSLAMGTSAQTHTSSDLKINGIKEHDQDDIEKYRKNSSCCCHCFCTHNIASK